MADDDATLVDGNASKADPATTTHNSDHLAVGHAHDRDCRVGVGVLDEAVALLRSDTALRELDAFHTGGQLVNEALDGGVLSQRRRLTAMMDATP